MRPAISDSLISGQPLYLLYSNAGLPACALAAAATGSVRLQVTGRPPTSKGSVDARAGAPASIGQATAPMNRRLRHTSADSGVGGWTAGISGEIGMACEFSPRANAWR